LKDVNLSVIKCGKAWIRRAELVEPSGGLRLGTDSLRTFAGAEIEDKIAARSI